MEDEIKNYIDSRLIGDGCISIANKKYFRFGQSCKFKEHLEKIKNNLSSFGIRSYNITKRIKILNAKKYIGYQLITKHDDIFKEIYNKWYLKNHYFCPKCEIIFEIKTAKLKQWNSNKGNFIYYCPSCNTLLQKKIIPKDIKFTSNFIREWWKDDGGSCKTWEEVGFSSCCFLRSDVKFLIKELCKVGINGRYKKDTNSIRITQKRNIKNFFKYIGKCDEKCFLYKWPLDLQIFNYQRYKRNWKSFNWNKVKTLRNKGIYWRDIAKIFNVPHSTLFFYAKEYLGDDI